MVFISGLELSDRNTRCLPSAQLAVDWIVGEAGEMDDQVDKNEISNIELPWLSRRIYSSVMIFLI